MFSKGPSPALKFLIILILIVIQVRQEMICLIPTMFANRFLLPCNKPILHSVIAFQTPGSFLHLFAIRWPLLPRQRVGQEIAVLQPRWETDNWLTHEGSSLLLTVWCREANVVSTKWEHCLTITMYYMQYLQFVLVWVLVSLQWPLVHWFCGNPTMPYALGARCFEQPKGMDI